MVFVMFFVISLCSCRRSDLDTAEVEQLEEVNPTTEVETEDIINPVISFYEPSKINDYGRSEVESNETFQKAVDVYSQFAVNLLKDNLDKENNDIISPLSFYYAMAILTNGANNKTKSQLESYLGMTTEDLNEFLFDLDRSSNLNKANALWLDSQKIKLKQSYLDIVEQYYGPSVFSHDFSQKNSLVKDVNLWVSDNTENSINNIISEEDIGDDTTIIILNALVTGDRWFFEFFPSETYLEPFRTSDGSDNLTDMMHQQLIGYWHDNNAQGFVKYLKDGNSFVAILPNEGIDIYDYINSMNGTTLRDFIQSGKFSDTVDEYVLDPESDYPQTCRIYDQHITNLTFPKFEFEREYELSDKLKNSPIKDIFNHSTADFSSMTGDNLYVDIIRQKDYVRVNEEEATARAVTMITGGLGAADCDEIRNTYEYDVSFDRPFLFAFVDSNDVPLFFGVISDIGVKTDNILTIENIVGPINIRSLPSTSGDKVGSFEQGQIRYSSEKKEAEGYTWYKIGDNKWVADDGTWLQIK